ncbi:hypothetical protein Tco_1123716 [Tanacetum coccineum]|uniref:Phosphoprotein n=1 Tax=Tanacetum coccineum TaxID=301880 RepID=A0ABQ5J449_9ASTR
MCQTPRQIKRGRDTKIPQSSGPPEKVGDEAVHKELGDRMERAATTASSLEAEQDSGSGPRCQDTILGGVDAQTSNMKRDSKGYTGVDTPLFQTMLVQGQTLQGEGSKILTHVADEAASIVHTLESDEGRMQPNELMELVTKLLDKVAVLENDLKQTKKTYGANFEFTALKEVYTTEPDISTANVPVSTAGASTRKRRIL